MESRLPLPSLLSHLLVAFTIEFDNEFEHQMPHRTTNHGSTTGSRDVPWLVSMAMWTNFMQFVTEEGIEVRELKSRLRLSGPAMRNWLTRMGHWWGYVAVQGNVVRPTKAGLQALQVWRPLIGTIEARWNERFGSEEMHRLRDALAAVAVRIDVKIPARLPILGYGLFSRAADREELVEESSPLPALLSKVLLAFAIEFESLSDVSLAISSNILRLGGQEPVRVGDLPRLAGVSKEAVAMALSYLQKHEYVEIPAGGAKSLVLTAKGMQARKAYEQLIEAIEGRWQEHFGRDAMDRLRKSLERVARDKRALLFEGVKPYADGWRASVSAIEELPHYPTILHRGGFPDGS